MRRNVLLGGCLFAAMSIAGCQDQSTEPQSQSHIAASPSQVQLPPHAPGVERGNLKLPGRVRVSDQYIADAARRAINPGDHVCDPNLITPVVGYFLEEVTRTIVEEPAIFNFIFNAVWADLIPTWDALFFLTDAEPQSFGYNGQFTEILQKTHQDVKQFWNVPSDDIQLLAMKGTMLLDAARVARTYEHPEVPPFEGLSPEDAQFVAGLVRNAMLQSTTLNGGNHPLFSFNAFAVSDEEGVIPEKIVMGDGIMEGYARVGLGDVAPQAIYAHEFGHHIQFENGYFDEPIPGATDPDQAEQTRYTELMADAFAAYYLTHKRGATMNRKRVEQFLDVFFQIGDCAFNNPGHHGTYNQRMRAARFGFDVAEQAQKQGHVLTSQQFHALFQAAYPQLVAPDAPTT